MTTDKQAREMNERDLKADELYPKSGFKILDEQHIINLASNSAYRRGWNAALESEAVKELVECVNEMLASCRNKTSGPMRVNKYKAFKVQEALSSFTKAKGG
jgi:hypothetical protein